MENATKALLMAGGILIAILTISIIVSLFNQGGNVSRSYSKASDMEAVTKFNANFTKYIGKQLTIHEVVTISSYAKNNNVTIKGIKVIDDTTGKIKTDMIKTDVGRIQPGQDGNGQYTTQPAYQITINASDYDNETGRIKSITIGTNGWLRVYMKK